MNKESLLSKIKIDNKLDSINIPDQFDMYNLCLYDIADYNLKILCESARRYSEVIEHYKFGILCICNDDIYYNYRVPINMCKISIIEYNYKKGKRLSQYNGLFFSVVVSTIDDGPLVLHHKCDNVEEAEFLLEDFIKYVVESSVGLGVFLVNLSGFCDRHGFDKSLELDAS